MTTCCQTKTNCSPGDNEYEEREKFILNFTLVIALSVHTFDTYKRQICGQHLCVNSHTITNLITCLI